MSQALSPVGPGEYDTNAQENPFAVWLRNVPTWLDEDRWVLIPNWGNSNSVISFFRQIL